MNPVFYGTPPNGGMLSPPNGGNKKYNQTNIIYKINPNLLNSKIISEFIKFRTLLKSRARVTPPPYLIIV